jgi:hypothetical protein
VKFPPQLTRLKFDEKMTSALLFFAEINETLHACACLLISQRNPALGHPSQQIDAPAKNWLYCWQNLRQQPEVWFVTSQTRSPWMFPYSV